MVKKTTTKIIFLLPLTFLFIVWSSSYADIYKYIDENGVSHFTNVPKGNGYKKIISEGRKDILPPDGRDYSKKNVKNSTHYNHIINIKSRKYNIKSSLVRAIITTESNWNPTIVSKKGAIGLMQLMPSTVKDMQVNNPFDPEENIEGGIKYLSFLLDRFNGDLTLALAAYNAGPNMVERFGSIPPISETEEFVRQVFSIYKGKSQSKGSRIIYKINFDNGTILYTNTPSLYKKYKLSKF